jgi:hypothetical protein
MLYTILRHRRLSLPTFDSTLSHQRLQYSITRYHFFNVAVMKVRSRWTLLPNPDLLFGGASFDSALLAQQGIDKEYTTHARPS